MGIKVLSFPASKAWDEGEFDAAPVTKIMVSVGKNSKLLHAPDDRFDAHAEMGQGGVVFFFSLVGFPFLSFLGNVEESALFLIAPM
ncbi:hypothetical protein [Nitrosococcus oceani]|uniref:Uncharacterized protein n=1 Tax=Nitrosococcus oceani C-27 TaxID=314279 RepID=A0A0E2Z4Z4_9GAMM|nr:hypothetical protein [Nitrosococcus oceani]KFI20748.1 hypothetical protein IB75_01355 [Nitrosococcus oceani C-27]KFI23819.1 hypothetical protein HW44_01385 [Nitrosococcus oceani]GEM20551.1 hypothetical protein NONS58_19700 [Nitrosococcus oceani]